MGRGAASIPQPQKTPQTLIKPPNIEIVDLGIIDFGQVFTQGLTTLHDMQPGQFLKSIKFTDTDFIKAAKFPAHVTVGIGTIYSFHWFTFAWVGGKAEGGQGLTQVWDTDTFELPFKMAYGPAEATGAPNPISTQEGTQTLGKSGPIIVALNKNDGYQTDPCKKGHGFSYGSIAPWESKTVYGGEESIALPPEQATIVGLVLVHSVIKSEEEPEEHIIKRTTETEDIVWCNIGKTGASGNTIPIFEGEPEDANGVKWKELYRLRKFIRIERENTETKETVIEAEEEEISPPVGQIHAIAEIWTP